MFPTEIIVKILRFDKSLYHLSRTVSKDIRNVSLIDILQHEILQPITSNEISTLEKLEELEELYILIEIFTSVLYDGDGFCEKVTKHVKSNIGSNIKDSRYYC